MRPGSINDSHVGLTAKVKSYGGSIWQGIIVKARPYGPSGYAYALDDGSDYNLNLVVTDVIEIVQPRTA